MASNFTEVAITEIVDRLALPRTPRSAKLYRKIQLKARRSAASKRAIRWSLMLGNLAILVAIVLFVAQASRTSTAGVAKPASINPATTAINPVDQLSSANIALTVSRLTSLPETTAITNQADSQNTQLTMAPTSDNVTSKPQVVGTSYKSRYDIQTYVAQSGDTVSSVASKFNVTSDSIKWSNSLVNSNIAAGTKLVIPPVGTSGIVYTVKSGDTVASLAGKYSANADLIIEDNDAEIGGLYPGEQIIIPGGVQAAPPVVATASYNTSTTLSTGFAWGGGALYGGNGYDYGYCTWWAANQRLKYGLPMPTNLGDAWSWKYRAAAAGMSVSSTPVTHAIIWFPMAYPGHVGFVEAVNADGSITISEMNMRGWGVEDTQNIPASQVANYTYIN